VDQKEIFYATLSGNFHNETPDILALADTANGFYELCRRFWVLSKSFPPYPEDEVSDVILKYISEHKISNVSRFMDLIYKRFQDTQGPDDEPAQSIVTPSGEPRQQSSHFKSHGTYYNPIIPFTDFFRSLTVYIIKTTSNKE